MSGRVYWITGLTGSGKTTIGTALYYHFKKKGCNVTILDGDLMKEIASGSEKANYETHDRLIRAKRYSLMAKLLADQGQWVIVCAIAMFEEIRKWNRNNINGYIEIFLNPSKEVLKKRDQKKLLEDDWSKIEFPKRPDIVFRNDGSSTIREMVNEIASFVPLKEDDYNRDMEYWNSYYRGLKGELSKPSGFAVFVENKLESSSHIMELGCGNGRDSLYFLSKGHNVTAIDGSDAAIDMLNEATDNNDNIIFICDDFVKCHVLYQMQYDCVYSRFTLHAITEEQENQLLYNVKEALSLGGILCIEARTIHDDIFGKGEKVAHNAYKYNNHFRRFINVEEFKSKLKKHGFYIDYIEEAQGFSKTEESDPILMRVIARLKHS